MMNAKLLITAGVFLMTLNGYTIHNNTFVLNKMDNDSVTIRHFEFTYEVSLPTISDNVRELELWIPLPQSDEFQTINDIVIETSLPYDIMKDKKYNNKYLHINLKDKISTNLNIKINIKALRKERNGAALNKSKEDMNKYLQPNNLVPVDGEIKTEAEKVIAGARTEMDKAKAIYDHVIKTVKYDKSGTGWGKGDVIYVCEHRKGNCTDFHSLFIGMCRSINIPARFVIGFPLPSKQKEGDIGGYHCWAEFYIKDKGWYPVDASEAFKHPENKEYLFGNLDVNRIQFTTGRDILLKEQHETLKLNFFIYPYCLINGKPFDVDKKFYFKEIQ